MYLLRRIAFFRENNINLFFILQCRIWMWKEVFNVPLWIIWKSIFKHDFWKKKWDQNVENINLKHDSLYLVGNIAYLCNRNNENSKKRSPKHIFFSYISSFNQLNCKKLRMTNVKMISSSVQHFFFFVVKFDLECMT